MGKWKPWQLVFLAYLLLLNFVVFCALSVFLLNNFNKLAVPRGEARLAAAPEIPGTPAVATPTATFLPPAPPEAAGTSADTPVPVVIPPVNIPPVPPPQAVAAAPVPEATLTLAPTIAPTFTPSASPTTSATPTASPTATPSPTATATPSPTVTATPSSTATVPPTASPTPTPAEASTSVAMAIAANRSGLALESSADALDATALTNGSIALSWSPDVDSSPEYNIYSDMGSGFAVYVLKAKTRQPAFIDRQLRPNRSYNYQLTRVEAQQEVLVDRTTTATFDHRAAFAGSISFQDNAGEEPSPRPDLPPDAVPLSLISHNNYTDEFNTLTLAGEVSNDSGMSVGHSGIDVMFYDASGAQIDAVSGKTLLAVLSPGEKSPFVISLKRPEGAISHSLRAVAYPVPARQAAQLAVVATRQFEDDAGFFHVTGQIKNTGSVIARRLKVAVVLYDRHNRVVNVGETYTNPPNLRPAQPAEYEVIFSYFPDYFSQQVFPFEE